MITARLKITPTKAHRKGERFPKRQDRVRAAGFWGVDSDVTETEPLENHLIQLLDLLEGKAISVRELVREGYRGEFYCTDFLGAHASWLELGHHVLSRIAELEVELTINLYSYDEEETET